MKPTVHCHLIALAATSLMAISSACAATYYWEGNTTAAGYGTATGTWADPTVGSSTQGWTTATNATTAPGASITTTTADTVNFGNGATGLGAGTITVSGTVATGGITFASGSGSIVLSGGTINLAAASTITTNNSSNTISSTLSGAGTSLTKAGTGTLVLTGANTYTGATVINGGTLDLGGGGTTGSLASTVLTLNGGIFSFTRSDSATQNFTTTNINSSGASQISVAAGNILNLGTVTRATGVAFDFTNTGLGTVAADISSNTGGIMGGFTFGDTWAVANGAGNAITGLANGSYTATTGLATNAYAGNIDVDSSDATPDAGITVNSLRFSEGAANSLTLSGTNTITTGGILIGSGVGSNLSTITGGTLLGAASKDLSIIQNNTSGSLTISSVIANNGGATGLTKSGAGLLTLSGNNTFTGGLIIYDAGEVRLNHAGALNSTIGSQNAVTFGTGSAGTLSLNGNSVVVRSLSGSSGTTVQNASASAATLTIGNSANLSSTFTGVIQDGTGGGALSLAKAGTGTLVLSGNNTFSGGISINAGTLQVASSTNLGDSANTVTFTGNSTLQITSATTLSQGLTINSGVTGTFSAYNLNVTVGGLLAGSGTLVALNGGDPGRSLTFTSTNNTFSGDIVIYSASGAEYTSTLIMNSLADTPGSRIRLGNNNSRAFFTYGADAVAPLVLNNRQIDYNADGRNTSGLNNDATNVNSTVTVNTDLLVSRNANITFGLGGSNIGNNTFAGAIGDKTGYVTRLTKAGSGNWILSNANNSYTGATTISGGSLSVSKMTNYGVDSNIGKGTAGTAIAFGGGTLVYTGSGDDTNRLVQTSGGNGTILNNGTGALNFTETGNFNVQETTTSARTLSLGGTNGGTISGVIRNNSTGTMSLTKIGTGTWTLTATSSYTGTTSVNGGTLELKDTGAGRTQSYAGLTFGLGDGTLTSNRAGSGTFSTTFTTLTRSAGATGNFISTGGANGSEIILNTTGAAGYMGKGLFYNTSEIAWREGTNGYVRGINYGVDSGTSNVGTVAANTHMKFTSSVTRSGALELSSLHLAGDGVNWTNSTGVSNINGSLIKSGGGTSIISGAGTVGVNSNAELVIHTVASNDILEISSQMVTFGTGLTKSGAGTLILSNTNNTFNAPIFINSGTLSVGANVHLGSQTGGQTVHLRGGTLQATGTFGLFNGTAGTNNRAVTLLDQSGIDVTGSNTLTIAGVISNNASAGVTTPGFNKTGSGTLLLTGVNTYTGATNVNQGSLTVNGSLISSVTVASGATLGGSGTINNSVTIQSGGFINPGNSPGVLNTGNFTQAGTYNAEITGLTPGTGHDQINVTGTVNIAGGSLTALFSGLATYSANDLIFILLNDGTDAITGTYTGLAQGATVTSHGGFNWQISYVANNTGVGTGTFTGGNDIALIAVIPEPSVVLLSSLGVLLLFRRRR